MAAAKTSVRAEQDGLRVRMRALGLGRDEIAAEFARRYRLRPRAAYRHAYGWTLTQAADQVNAYAAQAGLDPSGKASMTASHLCEYEQWPASSGRKPSPQVLALLAHVYDTGVHRLLDLEDWENLARLTGFFSTEPTGPPRPPARHHRLWSHHPGPSRCHLMAKTDACRFPEPPTATLRSRRRSHLPAATTTAV